MHRLAVMLGVLMLAACGGSGTTTVEVTTTVHVTTTTTVAGTTSEAGPTTTQEPAGSDPDDAAGSLDIRDFSAERNGDLLSISLSTYESWDESVLTGPAPNKPGPNKLSFLYDTDLDGVTDFRAKLVFAGGELSAYITGPGTQLEPVPVERPDDFTVQFVHPVDVFFQTPDTDSDVDLQLQARSVFAGELDRAPDSGWLGVPFNP
ncbi:MAG: hypothetical protein ABI649_02420 [Gaiellaceae bacterium]